MLYCIMPYYGQPCSRTACVHPSPVTLSYGRSTDKDIHIYIYVYVYTYIYIYIWMTISRTFALGGTTCLTLLV